MEIKWRRVGDGYVCTETYVYFSPRYKKSRTVPKGEYSDGATCARDLRTRGWGVHDMFCRYGCWDDGTRVTNWQASRVLSDLLREDGHYTAAPFWCVATWLFGGGAAREGKVYR